MNEELKKIIERIKKLLAMAGDAGSPNEAAIAADRARRLMDKYQVGLEDLEGGNDGFEEASVDKPYKYLPQWKSMLAVAIGKFNDCKASLHYPDLKYVNGRYIREKSGVPPTCQIRYQGHKSDVQVAVAMWEYMSRSVDEWCKTYMKENHPDSKTYLAKIGDAFKKGMVNEIASRLRTMMNERKKMMHSSGTALVVIKMAAVEAKFGEAKYRSADVNVNTEDRGVVAAHAAGRVAGSQLPINPMVGESRQARIT